MLTDQWQGFTSLPDFVDPSLIPTHLKNLFDFLASRAVPRYNTVAERDAELASPPNGALCSVAGVLYTRRGGEWRRMHVENRIEAGNVSFSLGGASSATQAVAFASPFTTAPTVICSNGSPQTSPRLITAASGVTINGFTANFIIADGTTHTGTRQFNWLAIGV